MTGRAVAPVIVESLDYVWQRVRGRIDGLDAEEYLWEPARDAWTVRATPDGPRVDRAETEPDPAPVTTIAWRTYHIAVDCLEGYSERAFGRRGTDVTEGTWFLDPAEAAAALDAAWVAFRGGVGDLGEDGMWRPLGPAFGPFADESHAALLLHAQDELSHHGAEISLLRDLYRSR